MSYRVCGSDYWWGTSRTSCVFPVHLWLRCGECFEDVGLLSFETRNLADCLFLGFPGRLRFGHWLHPWLATCFGVGIFFISTFICLRFDLTSKLRFVDCYFLRLNGRWNRHYQRCPLSSSSLCLTQFNHFRISSHLLTLAREFRIVPYCLPKTDKSSVAYSSDISRLQSDSICRL